MKRKTIIIISYVFYVLAGAFVGCNFALEDEALLVLWILGGVFFVLGIVMDIIALKVQKKEPIESKRSFFDFEIKSDVNEAVKRVEELLAKKKYYLSDYGTEKVFQCGTGVMAARKILKIEVHDNVMHVEAWISQGVGKSVGVEHDLDTKYLGAVPISQLKKVVEEIKNCL